MVNAPNFNNQLFWDNFWPNFFADALVVIFFGIFLTRIISKLERPKLKLIASVEYSQQYKCYWLDIAVRNRGKTAVLKEQVNWHVYFPKYFKWDNLDGNRYPFDYPGDSQINGKIYQHLRNYNYNDPIFPEREITILQIRLKEISSDPIKIYYHFSGAVGLQPRWVRKYFWWTKLQDGSGNPKLKLLPYIKLNIK